MCSSTTTNYKVATPFFLMYFKPLLSNNYDIYNKNEFVISYSNIWLWIMINLIRFHYQKSIWTLRGTFLFKHFNRCFLNRMEGRAGGSQIFWFNRSGPVGRNLCRKTHTFRRIMLKQTKKTWNIRRKTPKQRNNVF